jgi:hypothetical protein
VSGEDRPKRSWREIDQMRDKARPRSERRPRGKAAEAQAAEATKEYLKEIDKIFAKGQGGAEGERLAKVIRDAHGTPGLPDACRAFLEAVGMPADPSILALFLDSGDPDLVVRALQVLLEIHRRGELEVSAGLRSQLRVLEQDFDDAVAEAAEELLEQL